jgi:hypothetical protein
MLAMIGGCLWLNLVGAQITNDQQRKLTFEEKLDKPITLDKGIDRKTPFKDALEFVSDRYDMTILIDDAAFKKHLKMNDVGDNPVHLPRLEGVRLGLVMALLAKQVKGTYEIKPDHLVIVPIENGKKVKGAKPSKVWEKASERVRECLQKPIDLDKGIWRNTPLKDALEFLSDRYDVAIILDYSAFKKGDKEVIIDDAPVFLPVQKQVKLGEVLKSLLKQVGAAYEVIDGAIIVAPPRKKDSV